MQLGLGSADRERCGTLRLALESGGLGQRDTVGALALTGGGGRVGGLLRLDQPGLGERGALGLLALTGEAGALGLGLRGQDLATAGSLRLLLHGVAGGIRLLLRLVLGRVGGLADLGVELALGQRGPLGHALLGGEDLLLARGGCQRSGRGRGGLGGLGLGGDLGVAKLELPLGVEDVLLGREPALLGGAPGVGLGDGRLLLDPRSLRAAHVGEVGAVVPDVGDLERVEDQALHGERGLDLLGDLGREVGPVADDLLDGQGADDAAQLPGERGWCPR